MTYIPENRDWRVTAHLPFSFANPFDSEKGSFLRQAGYEIPSWKDKLVFSLNKFMMITIKVTHKWK